MVYAPNFVENSGLTVTSLSVILRSENGFESKSPERVPSNHFLKSILKSNSLEVHCKIVDRYFQSND